MLQSQAAMVAKLSSLQREFILDHHNGLRPFWKTPIEMRTCESLIERELIRYEPDVRSRLGRPDGTMLTDPLGREVFGIIANWLIDTLIRISEKRENLRLLFNEDQQLALRHILSETAEHWRKQEHRDNINHTNKKMLL